MQTNSCLVSVTHSGNKHKIFTASSGDEEDDDVIYFIVKLWLKPVTI